MSRDSSGDLLEFSEDIHSTKISQCRLCQCNREKTQIDRRINRRIGKWIIHLPHQYVEQHCERSWSSVGWKT